MGRLAGALIRRAVAALLAPLALAGCGAPTPAAPEPVSTAVRQLGGVPYLEISVARPARTIVLLHGGPEVPTLGRVDPFDVHLARRFRARVVKPVYYGSAERPAARRLSLDLPVGTPLAEMARRLLEAKRASRAGMPRAVAEARLFVRAFDAPDTVLLGESFGALLAALAAADLRRGRLVLVAPMMATYREATAAVLDGRYRVRDPIELRVVMNGQDRTAALFPTPEAWRKAYTTVSLAYYEPWQDATLGRTLQRVSSRAGIVIGLRDRVAMVDGNEWRRLRAEAPAGTRFCIEPTLGHEWPNALPDANACFERLVER